MILIKAALTIVYTQDWWPSPWFLAACSMLAGAVWLSSYAIRLPFYRQWVNQLQSALGAVHLWAGICFAVVLITGAETSNRQPTRSSTAPRSWHSPAGFSTTCTGARLTRATTRPRRSSSSSGAGGFSPGSRPRAPGPQAPSLRAAAPASTRCPATTPARITPRARSPATTITWRRSRRSRVCTRTAATSCRARP